jgi:hypothetical protein
MSVITKTQLVTNLNNVLSNNRNPLTRGDELKSFLTDFIDTIFQNKLVYQTTISSGSVTEIPFSTHQLPFVTGVRIEDLSGNEIFVPNKIDSGSNKVTIYSDSNISYKIKLF